MTSVDNPIKLLRGNKTTSTNSVQNFLFAPVLTDVKPTMPTTTLIIPTMDGVGQRKIADQFFSGGFSRPNGGPKNSETSSWKQSFTALTNLCKTLYCRRSISFSRETLWSEILSSLSDFVASFASSSAHTLPFQCQKGFPGCSTWYWSHVRWARPQ